MQKQILATVNINIGLMKDNPCLIIREGDDIHALVNNLIKEYNLPQKAYSLIINRVEQ
jgi:hypothetical protein